MLFGQVWATVLVHVHPEIHPLKPLEPSFMCVKSMVGHTIYTRNAKYITGM